MSKTNSQKIFKTNREIHHQSKMYKLLEYFRNDFIKIKLCANLLLPS